MTKKSTDFSLIVVAAGSGVRLSSTVPKQYIHIGGKMVLRHTLDVFMSMDNLKQICVVINPDHKDFYNQAVYGLDVIKNCVGGSSRQESVLSGLKALSSLDNNDIILVHDAARPFVKCQEIEDLLEHMSENKAASLAVPVVDTLRYGDEQDLVEQNIERDHLWAMQTPQAFHYGVLCKAHEKANPENLYTDDTSLVSDIGIDVKLVKGGKQNFKITTQEDLYMAERMLSTEVCTGTGFDVHAFDEDSKGVESIRLCGVDIAHERRLKGHSDADVGLHALTDAILGAIGEGDIGLHFPPSNDDFKNMDSAVFLEHAVKLLRDKAGELINADVTLICERPKIGQYRDKIVKRVAEILAVSPTRINIKATTTESLGFTGREEGIAAQAIVSVSMPAKDNGE